MTPYSKWQKLGLLYCPPSTNRHPKLLTHAANPLAVLIEGDVFRIFYSGRDERNRSSVGAVDIDILKQKIVHDHHAPFFEHGQENDFYSDGVSIGNCYRVGEVQYMLFMGWQSPKNGHWRGDIGRLVVTKDLSLKLDCRTPLMGAELEDPISLSYPWVRVNHTNGYDMWYGSTIHWDAGNGEMLHVIKYASSVDGHSWKRKGLSIPYTLNEAQAFSRPTVLGNRDTGYKMWFSYRSGAGEKYRIGAAISHDAKKWKLSLDEVGIDVSTSGWDSDMIEYPFIIAHKGQNYLLYNGNGYGKTGFGLAVLERN